MLFLGLAVGVGALVTGLVALACGQPYGVWYPLLIGSFPLAVLASVFVFVARHRYRQVELRKMQAEELIS
jgi:hypothetical protein